MRAVNIWPDNPMGYSAGDIRERFQWTYPIVFSPLEKGVLYASSQHVWRSSTGGERWERISPDLTRHDPSTLGPSGGPITLDQTGVETYATVFTHRAVAPRARRHLGGQRRRSGARHARRRQDVEEHHPAGDARLRAYQPHRGLAPQVRAPPTWRPIAIRRPIARRTCSAPTTTAHRGRRSSAGCRPTTSPA